MQIKFLDVDKEGNRLVASHKKAIVDSTMVDLSVGAVVKGALLHRGRGAGVGAGGAAARSESHLLSHAPRVLLRGALGR